METTHTPGPWIISYPSGFNYNIFSREHKEICSIMGAYPDLEQSEEHEEENLSNARLIAAAPELLEALLFIVNDFPEPGEDARLTVDGYNKACEAINKAISKS